jgi:hypothetical protein
MSNNANDSLLVKSFNEKQPIQTIDKMLIICGCSERTIRRKIKANNIICCYNKNSLFYTLPSLAKFNQYGIWHHSKASFSRWGNLFETIVQLIDQSDKGFTSGELKSILKLRIYDALRILCQKNRIYKAEIKAQNVYFSTHAEINQKQIRKRKHYFLLKSVKLPENETIIAVLVELILNSDITPPKICKKLKKKGLKIKPIDVENVLEHYQLKKTSN